MIEPKAAAALRATVRVTSVIYLLYFLTAILAVFLVRGIVVSGDAAATANNLRAHESSFQLGFAIGLLANVCYVALIALFYELFKPVNRCVSLVAAFLGLVGCAVQTIGSLFQLAPLMVLNKGGGQSFSAFTAGQFQALALMFLKLQTPVAHLALVFFAFSCLLLGYLIWKSTFLPRILGVLLMVAGAGWLTFLWPPLAIALSRYTQPFGFLAELALMLWLLVRGVNVPRWQEQQASQAATQG